MKGLWRSSRQHWISVSCLLLWGAGVAPLWLASTAARAEAPRSSASTVDPGPGGRPPVVVPPAAAALPHQPITLKLIDLLRRNPSLRQILEQSLQNTGRFQKPYLPSYFAFLDRMITTVPHDKGWLPMNLDLYFVMQSSPDRVLLRNPDYQQWMHEFVGSIGAFLDTPASAALLKTFFEDPLFKVEDYVVSPSGWLTFNQFFARYVKPGKRPVHALADDRVIAAPADSIFMGQWAIRENSTITVKGLTWKISDLLAGSPYRDRFKGGVFTHSFLSPHDYHRFHSPVAGVIREIRPITGKVALDVVRTATGALAVSTSDTGYQFTQQRGLVILDSPLGLVAVIPVGMGIVSSVKFTPDPGARLIKGEELGYFAFGGSDMILLFEAGANVRFTAHEGVHYLQGQPIGHGTLRSLR